MADRLPNETIELVLSLSFDLPGAEDVDVDREQARRALLRASALVCRRWRPLAMRMLPISVVVRSADEVSAHAMASSRVHLDVSQTTCVTVACFEMDVADESRLHALATGMTGLYHIRLACASRLSGQFVRWPGRHMVVDDFDCGEHREVPLDWPDRDLFDILDASPGLVHLSLLKNIDLPYDGSVDLGVAFSARVETVRCGAHDEPFYFSRGALLCERGPLAHGSTAFAAFLRAQFRGWVVRRRRSSARQ